MQSPYKRSVVYDLETGGFKEEFNPIVEIAMVAVCLEKLEVIDEFSVILQPEINLSTIEEDSVKEAKELFKRISTVDPETKIKTLSLGSDKLTLKNLEPLVEQIDLFKEKIKSEYRSGILLYDDIEHLLNSDLKDIMEVYWESSYSKGAEAVHGISKKMMFEEGVSHKEAFEMCKNFLKSHTVGNSKPIIAGHNIGNLPRRIHKGKEEKPNGFDNRFMEVFFKKHKSDWFFSVNDLIWDTLQMARTKFFELSSFSLGVVANELGLTLKEAHRALADTKANAQVLIKMLKSLRGDGGENTKYKREKFTLNY